MFPELPANDDVSLPEQRMGKVFLFDFNSKQFVMKDGRPAEATYEQAIKQWVSMILITEQGKFRIYQGLDHGVQFASFIGRKDIPAAVIGSEVKRQIEEQLTRHPEIEGIEAFAIARSNGKAVIQFSVQTRLGLIEGIESEVIYSG